MFSAYHAVFVVPKSDYILQFHFVAYCLFSLHCGVEVYGVQAEVK